MPVEKKKFPEAARDLVELMATLPDSLSALAVIAVVVGGASLLNPAQWQWIEPALRLGGSTALLYWILVTAARRFASPTPVVPEGAAAYGVATHRQPLTADVRERCAIHEAGHLLALGLFPQRPLTIHAFVSEYASNPTGRVSWSYPGPHEQTTEWAAMLVDLAGQVAERVVFGDLKEGSSLDNRKWEQRAKAYLGAGYPVQHPWFILPDTAAEAEVNGATLRRLRAQQVAQLEEFFQANLGKLKSAAQQLQESGHLDTDAALPLLEGLHAVQPVELVEPEGSGR